MQTKTKTQTPKRRRPEGSGRPRFTEGKVITVMVKLSEEQYVYLRGTGNLSAEVRRLVDVARGAQYQAPKPSLAAKK